jgi:AcrR family transcriptional regulator
MTSARTPSEAPSLSPREAASAERRAAMLAAAKVVFLEEGYETASMDRIAEQAATTKRTLYDHFGSKEALFAAVVERGCANVVAQMPGPGDLPADPRAGLHEAAARIVALMTSPACSRLARIIAGEAERRPQFAATLQGAFDTGQAKLTAYLDTCVVSGRLKPHDTAQTARLFSDGISRAASHRALFGPAQDASDAMADAEVFVAAVLSRLGAA